MLSSILECLTIFFPHRHLFLLLYTISREIQGFFYNLQSTSVFDMLMPIFGQFDVIDKSRSITIKIQGF